jgi:osmotically-inducible protein OsmY
MKGKETPMTDDFVIKRDVEEELACDAGMDASSVDVSVRDGAVVLCGSTNSFADKFNAERTAQRVVGVKSVVNDISVSLRPEDERTDEEIAIACSYTLQNHEDVPPAVQATVTHGWVTLQGTVGTHSQRQAAETAVTYLIGVRGIVNRVAIRQRTLRERNTVRNGSGYSPLPMEQPPMACY